MRIEIHTRGIRTQDDLHDFIERRVGFALDRMEKRIDQVVVRMKDVNGPRGGVDKVCKIEIDLRPRGRLVVEERDSDIHAAAAIAIERAARVVRRTLDRRRDRTPIERRRTA